jgi:hypothetical protein
LQIVSSLQVAAVVQEITVTGRDARLQVLQEMAEQVEVSLVEAEHSE